ncbi:uncharacterized protein L3040_005250 [Drepanopeziza brunnea f. sp. 'multigermtubi']|nr:hypothetical protein L3040_005250 [Drepanopeziza brunnea f. sp. 'multigermtubi']
MASSSPLSQTPMEDAMRSKITAALAPSTLEIHNDSHLHSHHKAMRDSTSQETHFRVVITSEAFGGKMQPARHRMVYALLKEEMAREGGIHALQLRTRTLEEERKQEEREKEEKGGRFASTGKA